MSPRYARPSESEFVEDPIQALGNMVRARIIGHLRRYGPSTRGELAAGLEVGPSTVSKALLFLLRSGVLDTDPADPVPGQRVKYRVREDVVSEMWIQLGQAIGEL